MKRIACLSLFIAAFCWSVFVAVAEQKPAPSLSEDEKVLVLPYQYYYFLEAVDADGESKQQLHCYYPNTGVDVTLDYFLPDDFNVEPLHAIWHNPEDDTVYLVDEAGGRELRFLTIYHISTDNIVTEVLSLQGVKGNVYNDYDESDDCYVTVADGRVKIKGRTDTGRNINAWFPIDLEGL